MYKEAQIILHGEKLTKFCHILTVAKLWCPNGRHGLLGATLLWIKFSKPLWFGLHKICLIEIKKFLLPFTTKTPRLSCSFGVGNDRELTSMWVTHATPTCYMIGMRLDRTGNWFIIYSWDLLFCYSWATHVAGSCQYLRMSSGGRRPILVNWSL